RSVSRAALILHCIAAQAPLNLDSAVCFLIADAEKRPYIVVFQAESSSNTQLHLMNTSNIDRGKSIED
ncbi:MAG: hypothetical protein P8Z79_15180, partial [Sedimentisphaerales bacterium]